MLAVRETDSRMALLRRLSHRRSIACTQPPDRHFYPGSKQRRHRLAAALETIRIFGEAGRSIARLTTHSPAAHARSREGWTFRSPTSPAWVAAGPRRCRTLRWHAAISALDCSLVDATAAGAHGPERAGNQSPSRLLPALARLITAATRRNVRNSLSFLIPRFSSSALEETLNAAACTSRSRLAKQCWPGRPSSTLRSGTGRRVKSPHQAARPILAVYSQPWK